MQTRRYPQIETAYRIATARKEERGASAVGNMHKKLGKDRTCSSRDMLADRQTDAHTNRHGHHTTSPPYWGRRGNLVTCGLCRRVICGPTHGVKHATDRVGPDWTDLGQFCRVTTALCSRPSANVTASEMTHIVSSGALNSTPTNRQLMLYMGRACGSRCDDVIGRQTKRSL